MLRRASLCFSPVSPPPHHPQLIGLHDWAKRSNVIICPNAAGAGGLPDIAAFYTTEELKKKTYAEVEKIHCFMFGNGGTPSVRDARFGKESKYFSPNKAFSSRSLSSDIKIPLR